MAQTSREQPLRWWPFALAAPLVLAALVAAKSTSTGTHDIRVLAVAAVAGVLVFLALWRIPPAWTMSFGLALTMFGGNFAHMGLPSNLAPDRFVIGVALLATVARARGARDRPPIRFRSLYAVMYVAGVYAIASAMAAGTIGQKGPLFDLLDRMQILHWVVFIIAPAAFSTRADRRVLLATLVGMGVYLGFTGIFEIIGPHALVFPRYIENPKVGIHWGRARGPFVEAAVMGLALYACILAALIALREWHGKRARMIARIAILVCAISLLLTFQRSVWIAVAVAAPLTMLAVRELRRYLLPALACVAAIVGIAFVAIPAVRKAATSRAQDQGTVLSRTALNDAAFAMIDAKPFLGFGWGTFIGKASDYYQTTNSYSIAKEQSLPVHDVYLSIATDLGVVGLLLWLGILLWGVGGAVVRRRGPPDIRAWRIALGSLLVFWLVEGVTTPLDSTFKSLIIWLWAAVIVGSYYETQTGHELSPMQRKAVWHRSRATIVGN